MEFRQTSGFGFAQNIWGVKHTLVWEAAGLVLITYRVIWKCHLILTKKFISFHYFQSRQRETALEFLSVTKLGRNYVEPYIITSSFLVLFTTTHIHEVVASLKTNHLRRVQVLMTAFGL